MRLDSSHNFKVSNITAIILAAGEAKRLGEPKALLRFPNGRTLLEDQVKRLTAAGIPRTIVVLGAYIDEVKLAFKNLPVDWVENSNWKYGPFSSIQAAMKHVAFGENILILPIDTAGVSSSTINKICETGVATQMPVVPQFEGKCGHPVYLPAALQEKILNIDTASGRLDKILAAEKREIVNVPDPAILSNINTQADWINFTAKLENVLA